MGGRPSCGMENVSPTTNRLKKYAAISACLPRFKSMYASWNLTLSSKKNIRNAPPVGTVGISDWEAVDELNAEPTLKEYDYAKQRRKYQSWNTSPFCMNWQLPPDILFILFGARTQVHLHTIIWAHRWRNSRGDVRFPATVENRKHLSGKVELFNEMK